MTRAQALSLVRACWGKKAHIRYNRHALRAADRERARAELKALRANKPSVAVLLPEWKRRCDQLLGVALSEPYDVGYLIMGGLAFHISGSGDTWEEACRKAGLLNGSKP